MDAAFFQRVDWNAAPSSSVTVPNSRPVLKPRPEPTAKSAKVVQRVLPEEPPVEQMKVALQEAQMKVDHAGQKIGVAKLVDKPACPFCKEAHADRRHKCETISEKAPSLYSAFRTHPTLGVVSVALQLWKRVRMRLIGPLMVPVSKLIPGHSIIKDDLEKSMHRARIVRSKVHILKSFIVSDAPEVLEKQTAEFNQILPSSEYMKVIHLPDEDLFVSFAGSGRCFGLLMGTDPEHRHEMHVPVERHDPGPKGVSLVSKRLALERAAAANVYDFALQGGLSDPTSDALLGPDGEFLKTAASTTQDSQGIARRPRDLKVKEVEVDPVLQSIAAGFCRSWEPTSPPPPHSSYSSSHCSPPPPHSPSRLSSPSYGYSSPHAWQQVPSQLHSPSSTVALSRVSGANQCSPFV